MSQFDDFRKIYINNIMRREYPLLPAYFYYLEHTNVLNNVLDFDQFERLFMKSINKFIHPISLEAIGPIIDLEDVYNTLDRYYDIGYLHDKEDKLIKVV